MDFWKFYWFGLFFVSLLYIGSFVRFYRKDYSIQKEQAVGWENRYQVALLVPFLEGAFYLLICSLIVYFMISGRHRDAGETLQLLFLAPILFIAKIIYTAKGWHIVTTAKESNERIEDTDFFHLAKRQLIIIILYSLIIAVLFVGMFYPFGYEKAVAKRINTVKTNIELCQAALASYAAHPGGKYPVGSFDYYQFHDLFPNNILPDILDEWFIEGSFLYDSEDGTTYIIWIEAPDLIRVTPSRVVPTRYDPQEAE